MGRVELCARPCVQSVIATMSIFTAFRRRVTRRDPLFGSPRGTVLIPYLSRAGSVHERPWLAGVGVLRPVTRSAPTDTSAHHESTFNGDGYADPSRYGTEGIVLPGSDKHPEFGRCVVVCFRLFYRIFSFGLVTVTAGRLRVESMRSDGVDKPKAPPRTDVRFFVARSESVRATSMEVVCSHPLRRSC